MVHVHQGKPMWLRPWPHVAADHRATGVSIIAAHSSLCLLPLSLPPSTWQSITAGCCGALAPIAGASSIVLLGGHDLRIQAT